MSEVIISHLTLPLTIITFMLSFSLQTAVLAILAGPAQTVAKVSVPCRSVSSGVGGGL